ncbi:hypothetical protein [Paenibacillus sp. N3.4]|uniref:hypothetical protein n=1 Tax=Paenibacillus sp. N3.4 TaxID=2603222 RepID=UPI0011CACFF7|nr:hypothetical protein [Paenibacillus sp. N3.4]TXK71715.1 hypothetical protein FU659_32805 [Paenibacillus sp. N3.4]
MSLHFNKKVVHPVTILLAACLFFTACSEKDPNVVSNISENLETVPAQNTSDPSKETESTLLSSIPDRNVYLFVDYSDKVVLQIGERKQKFNWSYATPRLIMPSLQFHDYDMDGNDELAVVLNVGSGTGISLYELHMIEIAKEQTLSGDLNSEPFKDYTFSANDYLNQLREVVGFKTMTKAGQLIGQVFLGKNIHTINLTEYQSEGFSKIKDDLALGNIVHFQTDNNKLTAEIGIGMIIENVAEPQYIGYLYADVNYKAGKFRLSNFSFREEL